MSKLIRGYKNNIKILNLLEMMFVYGAFSKKGVMEIFDESHSSSEKRLSDLIKNFGKDHITSYTKSDENYYYASYNYFRDLYNYLMKVYYLKTSTTGRLKAYFLVLSVLSKQPDLSTYQVLDELADLGFVFNDSFMRSLLSDMSEHGIITKSSENRKHTYAITEDSLKDLSNDEIRNLHKALSFFSNTEYPFALGDLTKRNVEMYLREYRKTDYLSKDYLHVFNKGFHLTLYEELVIDLLSVIDNKESIKCYYNNENHDFYPIKFQVDIEENELYLLGKVNHTEGYIKVYELLHRLTPSFYSDINHTGSSVELELKLNFNTEEYYYFEVASLYPKARISIHNESLILDLRNYSEEKQIDIVLEQVTRLKTLKAPDAFRDKVVEIVSKGVSNYETI